MLYPQNEGIFIHVGPEVMVYFDSVSSESLAQGLTELVMKQ